MPTAPLDTVIVAVNAANTRLNGRVETLQAVGGQLVGNYQAFSQQVVNDAWRKLQQRLGDLRYSELQAETVFVAVPASASNDPMAQVYINYANYFDGVALQVAPVLPQNLICPYDLTERQNGSGALFTNMDKYLYNLPRVVKSNWNGRWLWRAQTLYLPGALTVTDIALLYAASLADFVDGATPWFTASIPILNCIDSLADYICREIAVARGDVAGAAAFQLSAEASAMLIVNRDTTAPKSIAKTSEYGKMQDQFTPNTGADTQPVKR